MTASVREGVLGVFRTRSKALAVGFTGRTGSGCTTAASILATKRFNQIKAEAETYGPEKRKQGIILKFAEKNWEPFYVISVSKLIVVSLIGKDVGALKASLDAVWGAKHSDKSSRTATSIFSVLSQCESEWDIHRKLLLEETDFEEKSVSSFFTFFDSKLDDASREVKRFLGEDSGRVLQAWGDNLRASGDSCESHFDTEKFFVLPQTIAMLVKRWQQLCDSRKQSARIAIDALRNPFEIMYLRENLPGFLTVGITTDDEDRRHRLTVLGMPPSAVDALDKKEYPARNKPLEGYAQFISQNIQACLEKCDILISNSGKHGKAHSPDPRTLSYQLLKYISLYLHPGLVTPSRDERCMQLAFAARANSGCISRQVGAVVADENYSIRSVGWNDVPKGQVPCSLRNVNDLIRLNDETSFSRYEFSNTEFRTHVEGSYPARGQLEQDGLPCPFCFKDEYNDLKGTDNQVHTRSLHAEENAFLQLAKYGSTGIASGVLFTTASPCELCAKKAFQLGITRIVFVDPYPGISHEHILMSGETSFRPTLELFSGAVGRAYHKLYDPLLPIKDELKARMSTAGIRSKALQHSDVAQPIEDQQPGLFGDSWN